MDRRSQRALFAREALSLPKVMSLSLFWSARAVALPTKVCVSAPMYRADLVKQFEDIFVRLLAGENSEAHERGLSFLFEVMAITLLSERCGISFDGVSPLRAKRRSPRKLDFTGDMWILGGRGESKRSFRATAVDKRITKQGIWITLSVGYDKAEAELSTALGVCETEV